MKPKPSCPFKFPLGIRHNPVNTKFFCLMDSRTLNIAIYLTEKEAQWLKSACEEKVKNDQEAKWMEKTLSELPQTANGPLNQKIADMILKEIRGKKCRKK